MKYLLTLLLIPCLAQAQLPDSIQKKIDRVFRMFTAKTPGCAVAVMKDDEVIFKKGYGMANLEYEIPNQPNTIFHIASESKQYVAFSMLLLEQQGKLTIDDDIRKHLSFVPDFGEKITIRQLIHHTSGLRDQWQLLVNAGWQMDDVITQDHVIKLVSKQKELNFKPGEEHMYCNTGYTLMAEIVKRVSGLSLRQFTKKFIFEPLGMNNTHFHDNYREIVKNRAYSYAQNNIGKFENAVLSYSIVGATSLFTTVEDEAKWLKNFSTGQVGGKDLISKMYQYGVLNDGRKLSYAFAIASDRLNGFEMIGHGGADAGYRTYAARIPEKKLGIIVFSNLGSVNPVQLARQVAEILVTDSISAEKPIAYTKFADSNFHKKLQGRFYADRGELAEFYWKNGMLYRRGTGGIKDSERKYSPLGNNRYGLEGSPLIMVLDDKNRNSDSVMEFRMINPTASLVFKRQPKTITRPGIEYAGTYVSDETDASYTISFKNDTLWVEHRKFETVPLKNIAPDLFTCNNWWMSNIQFLRDKSGRITAYEVNSGRIQHLKYKKQAGK